MPDSAPAPTLQEPGLAPEGAPSLEPTAIERVIAGDVCIGCGACAVAAPRAFTVAPDSRGQLGARMSPDASDADRSRASRVCPFAAGEETGEDEDTLAGRLFPAQATPHPAVGRHLACYAGHVAAEGYRRDGSSGGYLSWLLATLLERGEVDAVLHVRETEQATPDAPLYAFAASRSAEAVRAGAKSRYYPVTLAEVLSLVREEPGRYAVTGTPCFIKAVRLLQREEAVFAERIRYCVGLVCGHLKSAHFADLLGWQLGVQPGTLEEIDFRHKLPDRPASRYGVRLAGRDAEGRRIERTAAMSELLGGDWGVGYFKYGACEVCDDVTAETADVAVGDAWLPDYVRDSRGANVVVVRDPELQALTEQAIARGDLAFERVGADLVARSQEAGLRDRRAGLAYRLFRARQAGRWVPKKRVDPRDYRADRWFREQLELRSALADRSRLAFERALAEDSVEVFAAELRPLLARYRAHMRTPQALARRALRKALRLLGAKPHLPLPRSHER